MEKLFLKDYKPPTHQLISTELWFDIQKDFCRVLQKSTLTSIGGAKELWLDGEALELTSLKINGIQAQAGSYALEPGGLRLRTLPAQFELEIETRILPEFNTALEGLYKSGPYYCTQCEAQGFRRITYFLDRPDVMTKYVVHIEADRTLYPILLSNGDRIGQKDLGNGRHQVSWQDPFKKPSYLFALVAGDLGVLRDSFKTMHGKKVSLEIYSPHGTQDRCMHAMDSLKKSMKWDEERFGREYDLSTFMILAVDDFNMGAMENKGLNIFNSRLVFADLKTATDNDYFAIESVVAHEYFHNWTGNRVTLRDWFNLSLKEGLTVFRDQEFSMDMSSREMVRIDNVADLRGRQFSEDAGPNAHPIKPESCYAVDNFYTSTIYEKGSEIIRMMQTMVGRPGFRKGMDLYFERHDGQAVTIEDFAKAISDANNQDWSQFKLWYSQAGTPVVKVQESYLESTKQYKLTLTQSCPPSPSQPEKSAYHIPLELALLDNDGREITLSPQNGLVQNTENQWILHLREASQTWLFDNISTSPLLSINRQFSAPIHLEKISKPETLIFQMEKDQDAFNRWEASQTIYAQQFMSLLENPKHSIPTNILTVISKLISQNDRPADLRSAFLELPDDAYLVQLVRSFDAIKFFSARDSFEQQMAKQLETNLVEIYHDLHGKNLFSKDPKDFGKRKLKNAALGLLVHLEKYHELVHRQFETAQIMTDEQSAFFCLLGLNSPLREQAINSFYQKWKAQSLVLNKWFHLQAASRHHSTFQTVVRLSEHPDFHIKNPNRVYALLLGFGGNLVRFHEPNQDTYAFMADKIIELDKLNPQVATRVAGSFDLWKKLNESQRQKAHRELERMIRAELSKNTYEIVSKQLA